MEAIVLAGGLGTRLRSAVPDLPKAMAPIAGRPFLELLLTTLVRQGVNRVVLSLGYKAEVIVQHFGDRFSGLDIVCEIETTPLGTGGAVRAAMRHILSDHVLVLNGDTFLDIEVDSLEHQWELNHVPIVVARHVVDTSRYGRLSTSNGRIVAFEEKGVGGSGVINAGCYLLPTTILNDFPLGQPFSLENDFLAPQVRRCRFDFFLAHGTFIDIGIPPDYLMAQALLYNKEG